MPGEVAFVHKTLAAQLTQIRLFAGMDAEMEHIIVAAAKASATLLAGAHCHACMGASTVSLQVLTLVKPKMAIFTLKRLLTRVRP